MKVDLEQWSKAWPKYTECRLCGQPGEWFESPTGTWWSHLTHPVNEHDFLPILHYTDPRSMELDSTEWWMHQQMWDRESLIGILWRCAMPGFAPISEDHPDWPSFIRDAEDIIEWKATGKRP